MTGDQAGEIEQDIAALHERDQEHDPRQELDGEGGDKEVDAVGGVLVRGPVIGQGQDERGAEHHALYHESVENQDDAAHEEEEDDEIALARETQALAIGGVFVDCK